MAVEITPLGFQKPDGAELVKQGDNVIAANAQKAEDRHQEDRGRLGAIESKNTEQDGRLGTVEGKQAVKAVKLEAGKWVWGAAGATHYVIPDHTGALIVRPTPHPAPATTPALDW